MRRLILLMFIAFSPILIPELGQSFGHRGLFNNSVRSGSAELADCDRKSQEQRTYAIVGGVIVAAYLLADGIRGSLGAFVSGRPVGAVEPKPVSKT